MLYKILKNLISNNYFTNDDIKNKLNLFVLYNQLTQEQYAELMNMVEPPITPNSSETSITN